MGGTIIKFNELEIDLTDCEKKHFTIKAAAETKAENLIDWVYDPDDHFLVLIVKGMDIDEHGSLETYHKIIAYHLSTAHGPAQIVNGHSHPTLTLSWSAKLLETITSVSYHPGKLVLSTAQSVLLVDAVFGPIPKSKKEKGNRWIKHTVKDADGTPIDINRPLVRDGFVHVLGRNGTIVTIDIADPRVPTKVHLGGGGIAIDPVIIGDTLYFTQCYYLKSVRLNKDFNPLRVFEVKQLVDLNGIETDLIKDVFGSYAYNCGPLVQIGDLLLLSMSVQFTDKCSDYLTAQFPHQFRPST